MIRAVLYTVAAIIGSTIFSLLAVAAGIVYLLYARAVLAGRWVLRLPPLAAVALLALALPARAADVPMEARIAWTLPTLTAGGQPLTGALALTGIRLYVGTFSIPDQPQGAPQAILPATATTYTYKATVANGATLYVRLCAENIGGCSVLTPQVTRAIRVDVPGVPAGTAVTVTVVVSASNP